MKKHLIKILVLNLIFFILISAVTISKAVTVEAYFMSNTNFNIWGDGVQTTYNDAGYSTILKVGNNEYAVKNGTGSGENVTCTTNLSYVSDGAYVKITYTVKNESTTTKTIGVATHADIQINRDDYAEITNLEGNRGFMMTDGTYSFNFLGRQSYGATDVDTYWFGDYNIREDNMWNNSQTYVYGTGGRRGDSGMAFSWQNRTIAPGEELEFSALIGIGTLNTPPTITVTSGVEPVYYPNEYITFSGKVNDADTGDIVSIKYALDGGEERTIGGQYIPNGVPTDYSETMQLPSNLTAGEHYIQVWAIDDQNNMSQAIRFNFTTEVDITPPSATHTLNPSTWTNGSVNINLSVSDTQTGLKNITLPDGRIETSSNINYGVNANGQYYFKLEDNAGNINNYSVTVSNIDKGNPQIVVNPENCEWSQSVDVALSFTDVESGFKQYRYAITNSKDLPTSWSNYITNNEDIITINEEGRKYLHIIAEDNVGNISDDKIVGEYLIDKTKPTISIIGDNITPSVNNLILNIQANDNLSGVKILKLDGNIIFNGNQIFYKNGIHSIEIEDNAGNIYTGTFEINNIYYECNAGLDHPIYSSTYDSCPICESYRGLTVTENTHIYNSEKRGVKYDNPKQAEIIEYYDSIKENPEKVKQYQYELKVIYQGNEYKTGVEGIYNITQKAIDIVDIIADDRIYNGGKTVTLKGGRLVGVCDGDNVSFILPTTGEAENKDVGENRVSMGTITLLGDDSLNYILNQPKYGSIMVNIKQKKLSIINLTAKDKIYDGNTTVEIEGGAFEGLVTRDDVTPTIPQTGEAEYKDVGNWKVAINDIELTGEDVKNYNFIQPTYGEITVNISKKDLKIIELTSKDRIYNGSTEVEIEGGAFEGLVTGDDVTPTIPQTGEAEYKDVGNWKVAINDIELIGEDAKNYNFIQPTYGEITVNISKKDLKIIGLTSKDRIYNGSTEVEIEGGTFEGLVTGDDVTPTIPQTGEAEYKDVGNWKVAINDIELTGEDVKNYNFIQPTYGEITVNISKKDLRMININGKNRMYNGETTVEIEGGEFDVLEAGDDVTAILPQTGEAEDPNVGTWRVEIDNIELTGKDVKNYNFIQPEYGEIMVTISKEMGKLVIGCDSKKYDRIEVEPYIIEKNTTSEVTYKYFISETDEEIERPYDIGTYDVVAYAETDGNYTEVESNRVTFEITKPDAPEINIIGRISKINDKTVRKQDSSDLTEVKYGDTITVQIRVENTGKGSGYAKEIRGKIDDGLEFIEDSEINKENGWIKEGDEIVTTKLSLEEDINNELYPKANNTEESTDNSEENNENQENDEIANDDITENQSDALENNEKITTNEDNITEDMIEKIGEEENNVNNENIEQEEIDSEEIAEDNEIYQENTDTAILDIILKNRDAIELELKVVKNNKENINLTNLLSVKQQDKRGDEVEYTEDNKEKSESTVEMEYKYADLKISKRILQVMTTDTVTNTVKKYDIYQEPDKIVKLDLPNKSQENTKLDIIYEITVTNEGNYNTAIDEIVDILPQHVSFAKENNEGWEIEQNGTISYKNFDDYLRPTESKSIELQLTYNMDAGGVAEVDNEVFVLASTDLDEILILEDNFKIGQTNNYSESKLMVSIITGGTILIYALTILVGMGIIVAGISLIKKYVL